MMASHASLVTPSGTVSNFLLIPTVMACSPRLMLWLVVHEFSGARAVASCWREAVSAQS